MPEPISETPQSGATEASSWGRIWGAITAPTEAFAGLATKPVFAVALVCLLVVGIAVGWVAMGKISPEDFARSIEESGRPVPPQLEDDPDAFLARIRMVQTIAGGIFAALFYFAAAGLFLVSFRMLGSDLSFRQSMSTTVHGLLPLGVAALVGLVVLYGRSEVSLSELQAGGVVASNLGFLAGEETSKVMRGLLTSIDLFSLWSLYLLALGYRIVARVSSGAAWAVCLTLWGVGVGIKLILASIF